MENLIKVLEHMAAELEDQNLYDRDNIDPEVLERLDRAWVRIHRICHNFKDDAFRNDVRHQWIPQPPWEVQ